MTAETPLPASASAARTWAGSSGSSRPASPSAPAEEPGPLAETFVINELRAYLGYSSCDCKLCFWRSYDGTEVDVLCETAEGFVAIEIKASPRWDERFNRGLHRVRDDLGRDRKACHGVYLGQRAALWDDVRVLPLVDFLKRPWAGEIIGAACPLL